MSIRYLIATALMASACAAHADVIPSAGTPGIVNGSNVAGAVGSDSVIAGVNRAAGSDALVQALFEKVSASVGHDMKVSLKQGIDGVYVTGLSTAKAAALAGDGMSVISTSDGFKIVASAPAGNGGGASESNGTPPGSNSGNGVGPSGNAGLNNGPDSLPDAALENSQGLGVSAGLGNQAAAADVAAVPEPSSIALMLAGMLGVAGLARRRAR